MGDKRVRLYTLRPEALEPLSTWVAELGNSWQVQLESFKDYVALRSEGNAKSR